MGTHNRERRKAKQKAREQRQRAYVGHRATGAPGSEREYVFGVVHGALTAYGDGDLAAVEKHLDQLTAAPVAIVDAAIADIAEHAIGLLWRRGWQPADVVRAVGREVGKRDARLVVDLIGAEMRRYAGATVDERWDAQLRALDVQVWWIDDTDHLRMWAARERIDRVAVIRCAIEVLGVIHFLPDLPLLMPPPGDARTGSLRADRLAGNAARSGANAARSGANAARSGANAARPGANAARPGRNAVRPDGNGADQRILARIRALLAKAESTDYPEEAEAFTAKAQELMARYSIDHALLAAQEGDHDKPVGIRIGVDNPYENAKALLLQTVAEANLCRAVWSTNLGFSTVFGFASDLDVVELMFTSLLVQGTSAMVREGSRTDLHGRSRTRSFRQSFLQAYAARIGARLRDVSTRTSSDAAAGDARLLPVLASREEAVRRTVSESFPEFVSHSVRINNAQGWASGTAAADLVVLDGHRAVAN